eukprot:TRINITY_DN3194_c0_g1_i1.p2 TRINITY_DN3194_c0_g1~~TRINITY_DN3194_c0_g1_i1.p2  ORF type:complete len:100 (+),score=3.32 TRINITY_DN3194_c0_g1_i1:173-472(+)
METCNEVRITRTIHGGHDSVNCQPLLCNRIRVTAWALRTRATGLRETIYHPTKPEHRYLFTPSLAAWKCLSPPHTRFAGRAPQTASTLLVFVPYPARKG